MPVSYRFACSVVTTALVLAGVSVAGAQPLGTFRWQQQPYCNVLTLNVVQSGGIYQLDGYDDQCGATTRAAVVGIAFINPNGTVGIGLTLVTTPGGTPLHIDATLNLPAISGDWRDSAGATGPFVLTPGAAIPGAPRPAPRAVFPAGLSAGGTTIGNVAPPVAATDAATKGYVDSAAAAKANTADVRAALLGEKVWVAEVASDGTKATTGPFTSSTFAAGQYSVVFNVTGLGLPLIDFANFVLTPRCAGFATSISSRSTTSVGGILTAFSGSYTVTNTAGTATNCAVFVMAQFPDPDAPGSPVPPFILDGGRPGVTCTTEGEVTTCVESSAQPAAPVQ